MQNYLDLLSDLEFEFSGGWFGLIGRGIVFLIKWAIIAILIALALKYI